MLKVFRSFEEFENYTDKFENSFEYQFKPSLIDDGWKISADLMIKCKRWKTAINHFRKEFSGYNRDLSAWIDCIEESCENGYFTEKCVNNGFNDSYAWSVEQIDENLWYIYINTSGCYLSRETRAEEKKEEERKTMITEKKAERINEQYSNISEWKARAEKVYHECMENGKDGIVQVTVPSNDHKLHGFDGINTSVTNNPMCLYRRWKALQEMDFSCVCLYCYADNLMHCYKTAERVAMYNQYILTSHKLSRLEIMSIRLHYGNYVRFEMFGDSSNITQAENYNAIAFEWKDNKFGLWSKNGKQHYKPVFEKYGKAPNLSFVKSSVRNNVVDDVDGDEWYVDSVFTVCENETEYKRLIEQYNGVACAGKDCIRCRKCYDYKRNENDGKVQYVFELLRNGGSKKKTRKA